jgi:DNA-binding Lrp family transcriptional regulator
MWTPRGAAAICAAIMPLMPTNEKFVRNVRPLPEADLSELDHKLIAQLQVDGRCSFAQLARDFKTTEKTVRKRVMELRESGLIEITTVTDPRILGYHSSAIVGVRLDGRYRAADVARDIFALTPVDYMVVTSGRYDLLVEVLCRDESALYRAVDRDIRGHPAVREIEVYPYLRLHYQQPSWDVAQGRRKRLQKSVAEPSGFKLSDVDFEIIYDLNHDGRVPFSNIADRIGVSETLVRKRYAALTEAAGLRVMALTNPRSIGYKTLAWLCVAVGSGFKVAALADRLAALPSITYLAICVGRFDIFAEVVCRDQTDLLELVDDEVRSLQDIARLEVMLCLDLFYRRVSPDRQTYATAKRETEGHFGTRSARLRMSNTHTEKPRSRRSHARLSRSLHE